MLIFYFFALIQLFLSYKSLRGGVDYLNYFKQELAQDEKDFEPFATIIVPCRGIDRDLEANLGKLFEQDYAHYEIVFVVDNEKDESVEIIKRLRGNNIPSKLVVAGKATDCGQKVHNLRRAVEEISDATRALVFVDSDARPGKRWLHNLITPLADKNVGCSTGYRWFIQKSGGFSTQLRSVWNASIASALGRNTQSNFCWGGSTAIRREVFERLAIKEKWKGTLSDDFSLTNTIRETGLPIYFVPQCITATVEDCNFSELLEFTTRQMKVTRVYSPNLWRVSFIGAILFSTTLWGAVALLFINSGLHFWLLMLFIITIFLLGSGKAWIRLNAIKLVLGDYEKELEKQFVWHVLLWVVSPILFLYNNLSALISRKIVWRGIEYELESPNRTIVLRDDG